MTGKTVDEAVEAACASLELLRDEVSVEVLEMPQKRLFGNTLAKVRVYTNEDSFTMNDLLLPKDEEQLKVAVAENLPNEAIPSTEEQKILEVKEEVIIKQDDLPEEKEVEVTKQSNQPEQQIAEQEIEKAPQQIEENEERELTFDELPISAQAAYSYLIDVAEKMKLRNLTFKIVEAAGGVKFLADGDDAALLIGRRGETMDALQYLCLLVGNRAGGEYCKISLDVANYRGRREQALKGQAKRIADKVLKTRRSQTLDSMSPYERRIIHSTIQSIKGVQSESIGNDPNRRVVVFVEGDRPRPGNRGYRGRSSGGQSDRPRRDYQQHKPVTAERKKPEPREQDAVLEKNLYGKIDI